MNYDALKDLGEFVGLCLGSSVFLGTLFYLFDKQLSRSEETIQKSRKSPESNLELELLSPGAETTTLEPLESHLEGKTLDGEWYLWLNLTKDGDRNSFVENHLELRERFKEYGGKYSHLQIHDGNFDPLPKCVIVLVPRSVPSSRYCMAKTTGQFTPEIEGLRADLAAASLENRVVGPTNSPQAVIEYVDNFKLQEIVDKYSR